MLTNRETCAALRPLLVDYADGDLAAGQRPAVADHLEQCADCRATVAALQQSLILAQRLWQEAQTDAPGPANARPRRLAAALAVAAVVLLAVGLPLWMGLGRTPATPSGNGGVARLPDPSRAAPARSTAPMSVAEITRHLEREETAARLAQASVILAQRPEARGEAVAAMAHVRASYPDTAAGRALQRPTVASQGVRP